MSTESNPKDVMMLGNLEAGQEVQIAGVFYIVDDKRFDGEGNLQITFNRLVPKSRVRDN